MRPGKRDRDGFHKGILIPRGGQKQQQQNTLIHVFFWLSWELWKRIVLFLSSAWKLNSML